MGIGKGWVDLNGSGVALQGSIDVLHLLQSVTHVAVGISEVRVDPARQTKKYRLPCAHTEPIVPILH